LTRFFWSEKRVTAFRQCAEFCSIPVSSILEGNRPMVFTKRLREGVMSGEITCSVRIWVRPHVTVGARYRMGEGEIEIDSITPIGLPDITSELARESGFLGILDLLRVAKHGKGDKIYLIRFHYLASRAKRLDKSRRRADR